MATNISKNIQGNQTNETDPLAQITGPDWIFVPTYYIVVASLSFLTNGTVMSAFFLKSSLRTPFNIYLMNLVTANFIYACLESPPDIINNLYSGWWLGSGYCSVYQYGTYILEAGIRVCHTMITVNRLWAVLRPHSYRQNHRRWTACLICLAGWVYVHINILPGLIMDILYYRLPLVVNTCFLNTDAQWQWLLVMQILVYGMALLIMVGSYPVIWYRRRKRQNTIHHGNSLQSGTGGATVHTSKPSESSALPNIQDGMNGVAAQIDHPKNDGNLGSGNGISGGKGRKKSSKAFTILTVLTCGVMVSWTPILVYYTVTIWITIDNPIYLQIAIVLFAMQSLADPILFVCALPDLRETFRTLLRLNR